MQGWHEHAIKTKNNPPIRVLEVFIKNFGFEFFIFVFLRIFYLYFVKNNRQGDFQWKIFLKKSKKHQKHHS